MNNFFKIFLVFVFVCSSAQAGDQFRYDHYVIASLAFDFRALKTKTDFIKKYGSGLRAADQKALEKALKPLSELPRLVSRGNHLRIWSDKVGMIFDFSRIAKKIVVADGVQVLLDPSAPLAPQVEALVRKIEAKGQTAKLMDLLLPKAHAHPVVLGALAFVGMALASKVVDRYGSTILDLIDYNACWVIKDKMKVKDDTPVCRDYIKAQKELASQNPEVKAVAEALKDVEIDPIDISVETCPHQSADRTYKSEARFQKEATRVRVQVQLDGSKVKDFRVLEYESDNVVAVYLLKDQVLDKIKLPNPNAAGKADSLEPVEIEINAVGDLGDPVLAAKQKIHKGLFQKVGHRLGACKAREESRLQKIKNSGQEPGTK